MKAQPIRATNISPYDPKQGIRYAEPNTDELELKRASMIIKRQDVGYYTAITALVWNTLFAGIFGLAGFAFVVHRIFGGHVPLHPQIYFFVSALLCLACYVPMAYFNYESIVNPEISTRPQGFKKLWPFVCIPCFNSFFLIYSLLIFFKFFEEGNNLIFVVPLFFMGIINLLSIVVCILSYELFSGKAIESQNWLTIFKPYILSDPASDSARDSHI